MGKFIIGVFFFLLIGCGSDANGPNGGGLGSGNNGLGSTENAKGFAFEGVITRMNVINQQSCDILYLDVRGSIDTSSGFQNANPNRLKAYNPLNQLDSSCIKRRVLQISPNSQALQVGARVQGTFMPDGNSLVIRTIEVVGLAVSGTATQTSSRTPVTNSNSGDGAHGN